MSRGSAVWAAIVLAGSAWAVTKEFEVKVVAYPAPAKKGASAAAATKPISQVLRVKVVKQGDYSEFPEFTLKDSHSIDIIQHARNNIVWYTRSDSGELFGQKGGPDNPEPSNVFQEIVVNGSEPRKAFEAIGSTASLPVQEIASWVRRDGLVEDLVWNTGTIQSTFSFSGAAEGTVVYSYERHGKDSIKITLLRPDGSKVMDQIWGAPVRTTATAGQPLWSSLKAGTTVQLPTGEYATWKGPNQMPLISDEPPKPMLISLEAVVIAAGAAVAGAGLWAFLSSRKSPPHKTA